MTTAAGPTNPEAPNPQVPIAQKLRIHYAKRGRLRFTSHRDFGRAFERAVRRANIPIGFSSGYSPHPKISYAGASPTGAASEAEYLEIGVTRPCDPLDVQTRLDDALPDGLDIVEVVPASAGSLAERLQASRWTLAMEGADTGQVTRAVSNFLAAEVVEVERMTKKGVRTFDCRGAVAVMEARVDESTDQACAILEMVVRHGTPSVRPDDVLAGLRDIGGLILVCTPLATRLEQGPLDPQTGTVGDPLALDRDASD